jgi:hypothetical protein
VTWRRIDHTRAPVNTLAEVAGSLVAAAMDMEDFTAGVVDILEATLLIRMKPLAGRGRGETSSRRRIT